MTTVETTTVARTVTDFIHRADELRDESEHLADQVVGVIRTFEALFERIVVHLAKASEVEQSAATVAGLFDFEEDGERRQATIERGLQEMVLSASGVDTVRSWLRVLAQMADPGGSLLYERVQMAKANAKRPGLFDAVEGVAG